jgi:hypothetical protein
VDFARQGLTELQLEVEKLVSRLSAFLKQGDPLPPG